MPSLGTALQDRVSTCHCMRVLMQAAAASALLLHNGTQDDEAPAPAVAEVLELGPALYKVARVSCQQCCLLAVRLNPASDQQDLPMHGNRRRLLVDQLKCQQSLCLIVS